MTLPTRVALEAAIADLNELLRSDAVPAEAEMQAYFERNTVALQALGFDNVLAHPRLVGGSGGELVPDFMAWAPDGTATVIEIKRAITAAVVLGTDRRPRESAELTAAIAQGLEYIRFFSADDNRTHFTADNLQLCHADPALLVIIGRSAPEERLARLMLERSRSAMLVVKTYDELVQDLEAVRRRHFGDREGLEGASFHVLLRTHCQEASRGTLFSAGDSDEGRWRAWIGPGCELSLDVSPPGQDRWASIGSLPGGATLPDGEEVLLSYEFGSARGFATAAIYIDGKLVASADYYGEAPLPRLASLAGARIGASKFGDPGASFELISASAFKSTLDVWERHQLRYEMGEPRDV